MGFCQFVWDRRPISFTLRLSFLPVMARAAPTEFGSAEAKIPLSPGCASCAADTMNAEIFFSRQPIEEGTDDRRYDWHRGGGCPPTPACSYHERSRTHLSLDKDTPIPRPVTPPGDGAVVAIPEVGGLHHRYELRAA